MNLALTMLRPCLLVLLFGVLNLQAEEKPAVDHSAHQGMNHEGDHSAHNMTVDIDGAVMNENFDQLPRGCDAISRDYQITVHAGRDYASVEPGMIFGMSEPEIRVEPCSRIELTFINEDEVRHQWMVHGLPKYLYPAGMFHVEAVGGAQKTGTFIVPGDDQTYLLHCDLPQHMEKGMRGQLVVGQGSGNLWAVNGISDDFIRSSYLPHNAAWWLAGILLVGFALAMKLSR